MIVLVLPIGMHTGSSDSLGVAVGVHAGKGQIASVIRDCNGNALHSEVSPYDDVSGSAYLTIPRADNLNFVLGVRGGRWNSTAGFATPVGPIFSGTYGRTSDTDVRFSYVNPSLSIEGTKAGLGFGLILGDVPSSFGQGDNRLNYSWHIRLGSMKKGHFIVSMAENEPLISGGGHVDVGIGYPTGKHSHMFTGVNGGFYDRLGFLQQGRFRIIRPLSLDLSVRLGSAGGEFEGGFSGGLVFHIGR